MRECLIVLCLVSFAAAPAAAQTCTPSATVACLLADRFQVEVTWSDDPANLRTLPAWGLSGVGTVELVQDDDTAVFSFFAAGTPTMMVRLIDGGPINGQYWVFASAATDVAFTLTVTDTVGGDVNTYVQPQGVIVSPIIDVGAFDSLTAAASVSSTAGAGSPPRVTAAACGGTTLCLHGGRFEVEVDWVDFRFNGSGVGTPIPLSDTGGVFWLFRTSILDLSVAVIDGRTWNGHFWVHVATLTDTEWTMTIRDTTTGATWSYTNPVRTDSPVLDNEAFPSALLLETATAGVDADAGPGPYLLAGDPVTWSYDVTNITGAPLEAVFVTDDQGVAVQCPADTLGIGGSMTCTAAGTVSPGPYENEGRAAAELNVFKVTATDPSHHFGQSLALSLEARANGEDAPAPPGVEVEAGSELQWAFDVTNGSNVELTGVAVSDDGGVVPSCPTTQLAPGEAMQCTATSTAVEGTVLHVASVAGTAPGGQTVSAADDTWVRAEAAFVIPTLGEIGLALLALLLLVSGVLLVRRAV